MGSCLSCNEKKKDIKVASPIKPNSNNKKIDKPTTNIKEKNPKKENINIIKKVGNEAKEISKPNENVDLSNSKPIIEQENNKIPNSILFGEFSQDNVMSGEKKYYLECPQCKCVPHITDVELNSEKNDYIIKYICHCSGNVKQEDLTGLLTTIKPNNLCTFHPENRIEFFCLTCSLPICQKCKDDRHNIHQWEDNTIISLENMDKILKIEESNSKKNLGYNMIKRLYEYYKNKNNTNIKSVQIKISDVVQDSQAFGFGDNDNFEKGKSYKVIIKSQNIIEENPQENEIIKSEIFDNTMEYNNIKTINAHSDKVISLIELESGNIATGSNDNTIKIWDINTYECISTRYDTGFVFCLLEFGTNMILSGTSENKINLWDFNSDDQRPKFTFAEHSLWVTALVKCDDRYFASASNDTRILIWDYIENKLWEGIYGHEDSILTLIKLNDGNLCSGGADLIIKIWNWKEQILLFQLVGHTKMVKCIYQLKDDTILSGSEDIKVWKNHEVAYTLNEHSEPVRTFCQINDEYFASGSFDKTIKIWDIKNMKVVKTLCGHSANVICLLRLKNGKLCSTSSDHTIKIWG